MENFLAHKHSFPRLTSDDEARLVELWKDNTSRKKYIRELFTALNRPRGKVDETSEIEIENSIFKYFKLISSFNFWNYTNYEEVDSILTKIGQKESLNSVLNEHCPYTVYFGTKPIEARSEVKEKRVGKAYMGVKKSKPAMTRAGMMKISKRGLKKRSKPISSKKKA